ncbi:response regulator transcription factor [Ilyobacter polytropus]|uniref:Two component transcriptional regulator, winged helix family n=1 Tax=Ilyobacter polytropus (strain ATCC 51220 / DSM 2926 / LMG 16218 / CuHBu1) TaxID=572544 RepID=E3H6W9_ILYPC|nr:response regulator transcription factor [Ilyobacter polytropus]ADO82488.1 two component transcriptional regulator, winged helix family [Ilyobacter polytropus DSM 2926]
MDKKILLAEDDWKLRRIASDFLKKEGYLVIEAEDGEQAIEFFFNNKIDLVILDIMMPKLDGWDVCREIRSERKNVPIIMLTAKGDEDDILKGYKLKTDEYVTKPVSLKILMAKVKALLRRNNNDSIINMGKLIINDSSHVVTLDGEILELSPREYEMLLYFVINKGIALSREKIITSLWGYDYEGDRRAVDSQIKRIRKKLGGEYIETVRGVGYKFEVS